MKRIFLAIFSSIVLIFSLLNMTSCKEREEAISCFPRVPIDFGFNIYYEPYYYNLQNPGNYVVTTYFVGAGTEGLIIYRLNKGLLVYDRNAPHICPGSNTILTVEGGVIVCPKDGAKWFLQNGNPINEETLGKHLIMYNATLDNAGNVSISY